MITYSNQIKIVSSIALSFQQQKKINVSVSNTTLERDKVFLKPTKYQQQVEGNFKFISLWTIFKYQTPKIDTLKHLQNLEDVDIKVIMKEKEKILLYKNTINEDFTFTKSKVITPKNVLKMYKQGSVSLLYLYWYFKRHSMEEAPRLGKRTIERVNFFLGYFPSITKYLDEIN